MKRTIRLSESDLHRMISESVKRILREHYMDYPRNDEQLASTIDDAKRFLRDYGNYYENYPGPYVTITNGDSIEGIARHTNYMYNALKYQDCQDKELMGALKSFLDYLDSKETI